MPTTSTSQILGIIESMGSLASNIFSQHNLSGELQVVNRYLMI